MFHAQGSMQLTPRLRSCRRRTYPEYNTLALSIDKAQSLALDRLKPKHIVALGEACGLDTKTLIGTIVKLGQRRKAAEKAVPAAAEKIDAIGLGDDLLNLMERRWNGSFSLNWSVLVEEAIQRRKLLNMTQRQLASLAKVSAPTVSRFEQNAKDIQLSTRHSRDARCAGPDR